jgi:hypothetical protein
MDAEGARKLRERIEQRQRLHWQLARAVRAGEQDQADPDGEYLVSCREGVREYEPSPGTRYVKRLVEGRWITAPSIY